jgi:hypothetical protein
MRSIGSRNKTEEVNYAIRSTLAESLVLFLDPVSARTKELPPGATPVVRWLHHQPGASRRVLPPAEHLKSHLVLLPAELRVSQHLLLLAVLPVSHQLLLLTVLPVGHQVLPLAIRPMNLPVLRPEFPRAKAPVTKFGS